jgi:hypothetical protein
MKKLFTLTILSVLMAIFAFGKETPVPGNVLNALNDAVLAADSGDVLILAAGEIYPNQGSIDVDKDITIMGLGSIEEGNLPYIKEVPAQDGSYAAQSIQVLNTFKIYNVFFNGFRGEELNETNDRAIRVNSPIDTFIVDNCVFEQYRKRTIALNNTVEYFKCTNTIFNHNWKISGLDEGRPIDLRNGGHKMVWIENCTFVNSSDRHFRHQQFGSNKAPVVDTLIINQCTFLNSGNFRPSFTIQSVREFTFTNNLVVNSALFGSDTITNRKAELPYLEGSDAVTISGPFAVCPFTLTEVDSFNTVLTMSNNNIVQEAAVNALFDAGQQVSNPPLFNNEFAELIGEATVYFEEEITFNNVPATPYDMISDFVAKADTVSEGFQLAPEYNIEYMKYDLLDLGYSGASQSATAATDGGQLGDRRWEVSSTSAVEDHLAAAKQLKLIQNFPNPFSESTTVRFMLKEATDVNLTIYNLVGAQVRLVKDQFYSQGTHEVTIHRGNLEAGIYFLKLSSRNESDLIKLTVK